jgi:hypothetical protein
MLPFLASPWQHVATFRNTMISCYHFSYHHDNMLPLFEIQWFHVTMHFSKCNDFMLPFLVSSWQHVAPFLSTIISCNRFSYHHDNMLPLFELTWWHVAISCITMPMATCYHFLYHHGNMLPLFELTWWYVTISCTTMKTFLFQNAFYYFTLPESGLYKRWEYQPQKKACGQLAQHFAIFRMMPLEIIQSSIHVLRIQS